MTMRRLLVRGAYALPMALFILLFPLFLGSPLQWWNYVLAPVAFALSWVSQAMYDRRRHHRSPASGSAD
jgi:hypothetical protein